MAAAKSVADCARAVKEVPGYHGHSNAQENPGDNSGCTYGVWGATKWVQVLRKDGVEDPTCDAVDADANRRRVCACQPKTGAAASKAMDDVIGATSGALLGSEHGCFTKKWQGEPDPCSCGAKEFCVEEASSHSRSCRPCPSKDVANNCGALQHLNKTDCLLRCSGQRDAHRFRLSDAKLLEAQLTFGRSGWGTWGPVCDDGFDMAAATAICKEMKYEGAITYDGSWSKCGGNEELCRCDTPTAIMRSRNVAAASSTWTTAGAATGSAATAVKWTDWKYNFSNTAATVAAVTPAVYTSQVLSSNNAAEARRARVVCSATSDSCQVIDTGAGYESGPVWKRPQQTTIAWHLSS